MALFLRLNFYFLIVSLFVLRTQSLRPLARTVPNHRTRVLRTHLVDPSHALDTLQTMADWTTSVTSMAQTQMPTYDIIADSVVRHKDLFPLDQSDYIGTALLSLGLMIAASGGIGGGGILVPILIIVYGFDPKSAIALSNFAVLGSSLTNVFISSFKRHPEADRPLVDWDLIMVMEPLTIAGAVIGALAGKVLPDWFLVVSLVLILGRTSWTTLAKAKSQYNKESAERMEVDSSVRDCAGTVTTKRTGTVNGSETGVNRRAMELHMVHGKAVTELNDRKESFRAPFLPTARFDPSGIRRARQPTVQYRRAAIHENGEHEQNLVQEFGMLLLDEDYSDSDDIDNTRKEHNIGLDVGTVEQITISTNDELARLLEEEKKTPVDKVLLLTFMVAVTCALSILKGGGADFPSPVGIQCGSNEFWAVEGLTLAWIFGLSLWIRTQLIEKWEMKKRLNYQFLPGDVEWNERNTVVYPCVCTFAGIVAGMFGFGGGIVKGPLMLQMGVHPLVASATSSMMITFTAATTTAMFVAFGISTWDYAWFLFTIGLVSTTIGQLGVGYFVNKYKRYSYISMSIGAVVSISTVLMSYQSITSFMEGDMTAGNICGF